MQSQIGLGRVFGVRIGLHYSWFLIATLITLTLVEHLSVTQAAWSPVVIWATALVMALLFFASLLLHELAHAAAAQAQGLPVHSITLFALGGVAHVSEAADAKTELLTAVVGPLSSALIGVGDVKVSFHRLKAVTPETPILKALEILVEQGVNRLPVLVSGHLEGILSQNQIERLLQTRDELTRYAA